MDANRFCELLLGLAKQYQADKQPRPELELLVEAFQAGGAVQIADLSAWSNRRGYHPPAVRRRLRVASRVGIHYEDHRVFAAPSCPQTVHQIGATYPQPRAGAPAGASAAAAAGGPAAAAADAHNADARGFLFYLDFYSSLLSSSDARVSRAFALVRPPAGQEGEWMSHGEWLCEVADLALTVPRICDAAVAFYSAVCKYGSVSGVQDTCRAWVAQGPSGGWPGRRHFLKKTGFSEYITRDSFARLAVEHCPFAAFASEAINSLENQIDALDHLDQEESLRVSNEQVLQDVQAFLKGRRA